MAVTDLQRREILETPPFGSLGTRVTSLKKLDRSLADYRTFLRTLVTWVEDHADSALLVSGPRIFLQSLTPFQVIRLAIEDEQFQVVGGFDTLLWGWGWFPEYAELAFGQSKRRQAGLFIRARRTRSPRRNFVYQRVPHR